MTSIIELQSAHSETELWCDQAPEIKGEGLTPVTEVRLRSACQDGAGRTWESTNGYLVSAETRFSTHSTAAVGDDYYGIAPEGLFYSMRCQAGTGHDFVLPEDGQLNFEFQLQDGSSVIWSQSQQRLTRTEERSKRDVDVLFLHNKTPGAKHGAAMLESLGFRVYSFEIEPEKPNLDPLLQKFQGICQAGSNCHLVASSRASEAGLELAQRLPNLRSVTCFSGSALRFSPWTIEGEELPHVVCDHSSIQPRGGTHISTRKVYAEAVADRDNRNKGRIEVEKIACPLFFFSGADDQIWPSSAFSELGSQRRTANHLSETTYHKTFPSVGYDLGPELGLPGLPTTERSMAHSATGFRLALGGKMGRQSRARRECWNSLVSILEGATVAQLNDA